MVDNFELLSNIIDDEIDEGLFYICDLLYRSKDGSDLYRKEKICSYYIDCKGRLLECKREIVRICNDTGARAYLNLSPVLSKAVMNKILLLSSERMFTENYTKPWRIIDKAIGRSRARVGKKYLIDVDAEYLHLYDRMLDFLKEHHIEIVVTVNTKTGKHIITKPFDVRTFNEEFGLEVQKNIPTILYIPQYV